MKIKAILHIISFVALPALLLAQNGRQVTVSFPYKGGATASFRYVIEEGDVKKLENDNFQFVKDREITVKLKQLKWSDNIAPTDRVGLIFNASQATGSKTIVLEGPEDAVNFIFSLSGAENKFSIGISFNDSNNKINVSPGYLTLNFSKKEETQRPPQPAVEKTDPEPPPIQAPVETQEDKDWKTANSLNSLIGYKDFQKKYSASQKYGRQLKLKLHQLSPIRHRENRENDSTILVTFTNIIRKPVVEVGAGLHVLHEKLDPDKFEYAILVVVRQLDSVQIRVCDAQIPSSKIEGSCDAVEVGNPLIGAMMLKDDSVSFVIKGGAPPYALFFRSNDVDQYDVTEVTDTTLQVAWADLKPKLPPGTYTVEVTDANNAYFEILSPTLVIVWEVPLSWYFAGGAGIVLIFAFFLYKRLAASKKKRRREEMLRQIQEHKSDPAEPALEQPDPSLLPPIQEPIESGEVERAGNISIRPRPNESGVEKIMGTESFQLMVQPRTYLPLHLDRLWANSALKTIYFKRESILELDQFLRVENTSKIRENEKDIPEIGGMLLGKFTKDSHDHYEATVEKFTPIASKASNVYRLEFSVESFALDLTSIQDEFPELVLVGWFHTHPGHGLFLSPPDMKIQQHFREPYQFAMEIDSLTENLDTGFFTRQQDGKINNQENLRPGASWFAWTEIEKYTRKSK